MASGKDVRAGGAYVEVFTKDEQLDAGLRAANQKVRTAVGATKAVLLSAGSTAVSAAAVSYTALTVAGKGIAGAFGAMAPRMTGLVAKQGGGLDALTQALRNLTPLSVKAWNATQGGMGRAMSMLGSFRELLVASGAAAMPLVAAFDGIARKGAGIAYASRTGALLRGDVAAMVAANHALKAARGLYLADRMRGMGGNLARGMGGVVKTVTGAGGGWRGLGRDALGAARGFGAVAGQAGAWLNIRGGYAATAALTGALKLTYHAAQGLGRVTGVKTLLRQAGSLARSFLAVPSAAAGIGAIAAPCRLATAALQRLQGAAVATFSRLKGAAKSAFGVVKSAGMTVLAPLAVGAMLATQFTSRLAEVGDRAAAAGRTVEQQSTMESAAKLAGVTIEETVENKHDDPEERAAKAAKRARLESKMGEAGASGATVTTEQARVAREAATAMDAVKIALSGALARVMVTISGFIQQNPKLTGQIFGIAKAMGVAAAIAAALSAGIGFITSPMGVLAIVAGAATAAVSFFGEETKAILAPIGEVLATLQADFEEVFGGITDALAADDLALAAQIMWAGLTLEFNRGWAYLHAGWLDAKNATVGVIDGLLTSLRIKLDEWFPGFEAGWSGTLGFINDAWTISVNTLLNVWDEGFAILKKSLNYLKSLFDSTFDLTSANAAIDVAFANKVDARGTAQDELLARRDQERSKRTADLAQRGTAAVLRDEQQQRKGEREAARDAQAADQQALADAKAKLATLRDLARGEREAKESAAAKTVGHAADLATKGAVESTRRRGAEAHDIRTQGGASLLAMASRGTTQDQMLGLQKQQVKEAKEANALSTKNWIQLTAINNNLPLPAVAIG